MLSHEAFFPVLQCYLHSHQIRQSQQPSSFCASYASYVFCVSCASYLFSSSFLLLRFPKEHKLRLRNNLYHHSLSSATAERENYLWFTCTSFSLLFTFLLHFLFIWTVIYFPFLLCILLTYLFVLCTWVSFRLLYSYFCFIFARWIFPRFPRSGFFIFRRTIFSFSCLFRFVIWTWIFFRLP